MSVLAKEIQRKFELSQEYIQAGFQQAHTAGEMVAEVESMVGTDNLEEWLISNCSGCSVETLKTFLRFFKNKSIKLEVFWSLQEGKL